MLLEERFNSRLDHCAAVTLETPRKPRQARVANKADAAVAQTDQILSHILAAMNVVGKDNIALQLTLLANNIIAKYNMSNAFMI
jgi:hypothetical protein